MSWKPICQNPSIMFQKDGVIWHGRLISYHLTTGAEVRPPGIEPGTSAIVVAVEIREKNT